MTEIGGIKIIICGAEVLDRCPACRTVLAERAPTTHFHEGAQTYPLIDAPCARLVMLNSDVPEETEGHLERHLCRECQCGYGWIESLELGEPQEA